MRIEKVILDPGVEDTDGTSWCKHRVEVQKCVSGLQKNCQDYTLGVNTL